MRPVAVNLPYWWRREVSWEVEEMAFVLWEGPWSLWRSHTLEAQLIPAILAPGGRAAGPN